MTTIYYSKLVFQDWSLYLAATSEGLCFVGSSPASKDELNAWVDSHFPESSLIRHDVFLADYTEALTAYLSKQIKVFNVKTYAIGTSFQKKVWNSLLTIPYGETLSYSELAVRIGREPSAARSVGTAIGKNPLLIIYPCHRVVPKSSKPRGFRGGLEMKEGLLELERN